jgi:mannose-6-phosphate isomerase-like protein (cupin superfamily)
VSLPDVVVGLPGDSERLVLPFGEVVVRLDAAQTSGALSIIEMRLPGRTVGAAPHIHHGHQEYFHVVRGEVTFDLAGGPSTVGPGGVVCVPAGRVHGFRNSSDVDADLVGMFTPAGYEDYFREVAALYGEGADVTPDVLAALRSRYRTESAPPAPAG